ncbi:MAG: phosphatase PAP2 family protein [Oscillospiraceae bacterium]
MDIISLINDFDWLILNAIDNLKCGFMDGFMPFITSFGNIGWVWIFITICFLCTKKHRTCGFMIATALILSLIFGNIILKPLVARDRPFLANPDIMLLIRTPMDFSFPSGHSMTSFAAATVLLCYNKKFGIPALILAILIAFSRLYLQVHYPTDVISGIIIGIVFGFLAVTLVKKIKTQMTKR